MNRRRVMAVVRKELAEYGHNRLILITAVILPLVFLAIPTVSLVLIPADAPSEVLDAVVGQAMLFFLLIPVMIPTTIAAYTVIGEREQSTLEPVLTTPATDTELLVGKAAAATAPAVLISWLMFGVFVGITTGFAETDTVARVLRPEWVVVQALLVPVLALISIEAGMAVSARSTDIRVAQQVAGLVMLPVIGGIMVVAFGVIELTVQLLVGIAVVGAVAARYGFHWLIGLFDRERLLTRWG